MLAVGVVVREDFEGLGISAFRNQPTWGLREVIRDALAVEGLVGRWVDVAYLGNEPNEADLEN